MTKSNSTDKLKETLSQVEIDYGVPVEHPMAMTVAALVCLDFGIWFFGYGDDTEYVRSNGPHAKHRALCGPYAILHSKEESRIFNKYNEDDQSLTDFKTRNKELTIVNIRERSKLIDLLGEFYSQHNAPFGVRLAIDTFGNDESWLKSQASDVMALPENESYRNEWIKQSRAEMQAFTDFLIARL